MSPLARQALTLAGSCSALAVLLAGPAVLAAAVLAEWWATRTPAYEGDCL